jgi:methyltransferase
MLAAAVFLVFVPMLFEARLAAAHERAQRARGGMEPAGDVYKMMRIAYPGAFAAMLVEGAWRGGGPGGAAIAGLTLFAASKGLKYWAIASLGQSWTFRVIVVPGAPLVATGPYRWLRHPNYVAVAGELVGIALAAGAWLTGPIATAGFIALMSKRAAVETRMLQTASRGT